MSFLNKVFREILKIKPFFQSLGRFRLGVGVSFSADAPVTGDRDVRFFRCFSILGCFRILLHSTGLKMRITSVRGSFHVL